MKRTRKIDERLVDLLFERFMNERPYDLIALTVVRAGRQLPDDTQIREAIRKAVRLNASRGIKTVRLG